MKLIKFLVCLTILISFSRPVFAVEYGGLGGRPANPRSDNPRTESIFIHTLNIGEEKKDAVRVINNTADKKEIMVYVVDSVKSTDGAFACAQLVDAKKDVGSWVSFEKQELSLESMTNEVIPFIINVPKSAGVGEHNGCIVIQENKVGEAQGDGVQLSFRTAMRIAILIPGEIEKRVEIAGFAVNKKNKDFYTLVPEVKNMGNVSVDTQVSVVTKYFFGKTLQENGGQYPVLRNDLSSWNFELKKPFWGGLYKSTLVVKYNDDANSNIGENNDSELTTLQGPTKWFFAVPDLIAIFIEIGIIIFIILLLVLVTKKIKKNRKNKK